MWDSFAVKVGTLGKWPNYCAWAAGWAQRILLSVCWTTSLVEELGNLLSGVCVVGKELVDQAAASESELWEGGELGGDVHFFLRMYCSVGREQLPAPCSTDLGIIS